MLALLALGVALTGPVPAAIERSVKERMGEVRVTVTELDGAERFEGARVRGCEGAGATVRGCDGAKVRFTAVPEPGSRLGRTIRFQLFAGGTRTGSVVAKIEVTGAAVRAVRALSRGDDVGADDVEVADAELKNVLIKRLPALHDVVGAEARRDIAASEMLTDAVVLVPPTVRSGDEVRVSVMAGPIEVTGTGRASGSGRVGDVIRVLVPSSRTGLKARITGPGSVEIVR